MRFLFLLLVLSLFPRISEAQTSACSLQNPPENCESMLYAQADALVSAIGLPYGKIDPICGSDEGPKALKATVDLLISLHGAGSYQDKAGDLFKFIRDSGIAGVLAEGTSGFLHDFIMRNGAKAEFANCATLAVLLPKDATVVGTRLLNTDIDASAADPGRHGVCEPGKDCSNGWARYMSYPTEDDQAVGNTVSTVFANWSDNRRRVAHFIVFFKMPSGKQIIPLI